MNVNLQNPSALRRKLTIELEPAEIKTELDRAYNDLRRNVVLKGFRPGHAPRTMLERLFGDRVRGEIVQKLIKEYTDKALEEQNLSPSCRRKSSPRKATSPRRCASARPSICAPR